MFGLGPTELVVILVLALLVMGPARIPELAANMGKAIRSFRKATKELRDQIEIDEDVRRPFEDLRAAIHDEPARPAQRYSLLTPAAPPQGAESAGTGEDEQAGSVGEGTGESPQGAEAAGGSAVGEPVAGVSAASARAAEHT